MTIDSIVNQEFKKIGEKSLLLFNTYLQKIRTFDEGQIVCDFYQKDQGSLSLVADLISITPSDTFEKKPPSRSLVVQEIARRYLLQKKVKTIQIEQNSLCLIIIFENECGLLLEWTPEGRFCILTECFQNHSPISVVEWSPHYIYTKKRETFKIQPHFLLLNETNLQSHTHEFINQKVIQQKLKTRERFLKRRIDRQEKDFHHLIEPHILKNQIDGIKACLSLEQKAFPLFQVPPEILEWSHLPKEIEIPYGKTLIHLLEEKVKKLKKSKNTRLFLEKRIQESKEELDSFLKLKKRFEEGDSTILKEIIPFEKKGMKEKEKERKTKSIYQVFQPFPETEIRVCKKASHVRDFLKLMPHHHLWFHTVDGQGAHVWLVKPEKEASEEEKIFARKLAIAFSTQQKQQEGFVHETARRNLFQRKKQKDGQVFIRRSSTKHVKYQNKEMKDMLQRKQRTG